MTQITKRTQAPYRYDVVGSFLRPAALKEARAKFQHGEIDDDALRQVEDQEIIQLIQQQEAAGLKAITDGEFRRSWWHLDFFWGLQGVEKTVPAHGYTFAAVETRNESAQLTGPISGENHPFVEHFKFVRDHLTRDDVEAKQTIPAPAQFLRELLREDAYKTVEPFYPTIEALVDAIAAAYRTVIHDLYEAGARVVQIDDCTWGALVDNDKELYPQEQALGRDQLKRLFLDVNNKAIEDRPEDLVIATHICRGNYRSTYFSKGAYTGVADPLFREEDVDAYFLEYDSERAGGFEPLSEVTGEKLVVLGLITSKDGELEDRQAVIDRINEASEFIPLDRLCLSTQCGFASTEEGNELTEEQQWAKIQLVKSIAEEVWG